MTSPHPPAPSAAQPSAVNEALVPVSADRRVFQWHDHASLWFSLGVGLLVMQVGAYLLPALSTQQAVLAIVCGSLLGAGLLGWMAKIACDTGLSSAALMTHVYGRQFAKLPILLNLVQLIGWGTFELVVMRDASVAIARQAGGMAASHWPVVMTLVWGAVIGLLISGSMLKLVRQLIARIALPLVVLSLLWLTWHFVGLALEQGWEGIWQRPGTGGMGWLPAMDLVVVMPISWLPLVADYARHGRDGRSALRGTWLGFGLANVWCYGLGVLITLTLPSENLVTALLLAVPFAMQNRQHQRHLLTAAEYTPHQVGPFVAVENAVEQLHPCIRRLPEAGGQLGFQQARPQLAIAFQMGKGRLQRCLLQRPGQCPGPVAVDRMTAAQLDARTVRGIFTGAVDEHPVVADMAMLKYRTEQRIEKGLGQLVIQPLADQIGIVPAGFAPGLAVGQHVLGKRTLQAPQRVLDFFAVEIDPRRRGLLRLAPGRIAKAAAGVLSNLLEACTVLIEPMQYRRRQAVGRRVFHQTGSRR